MFRLLAVVVVLAPVAVARADAAPPDGYVDPCASMTFADSCRRCTVPDFKARDCHEGARTAGLVERCRGWSYAMYCGKEGVEAPAQPKPGEPSTPSPAVAGPPAPGPAPAQPAAPGPTSTPAQQAAPGPAPAVGGGGGCTIAGHGDGVGLGLVLLLAGLFRRRH